MDRLVERESATAVLRAAVARRAPHVLVSGEAGSGKTSLVRSLLAGYAPGSYVVGACDSLRTARPLAPFLDWGQDPEEVLASKQLAVVAVLHWADDATLDLLARWARRHRPGTATLLLTYRDDEVGAGHPLALLLGDLAGHSPTRLAVPPLSRGAVAELAHGSGLAAEALYETTGGNAFFVTECLANGSLDASANVRDAVLARTARLTPEGRGAVEAVSAVPGRCELWLAEALGADPAAIDEVVTRGVLVPGPDGTVSARHELARLTVHDALPPARRRDLHRAAATALASPVMGAVDHARVVHHAVLGTDPARLAEHVVPAADAATAAGARSQAVEHLELAVRYVPPGADRLALWARLAAELSLLGRDQEAVEAYEQAIALAREADDTDEAGVLLARLAMPLSMAGRASQARSAAHEAVRLLENHPGRGLALACAQMASQHMLAREFAAAEPWGARALALARELEDVDTEAYTSIQWGVARWMAGDEAGLATIHYGIDLARHHGLAGHVAHGLSQIGSGGGEIRRYREAVAALEECIAWSERNELWSRGRYAQAWLGRCLAETGEWGRAGLALDAVLRSQRAETITRVTALAALGRLRVRRGDPGARELLDEALSLAAPTGQLQRIWPVAVARAEAAWWAGDVTPELALLRESYAQAVSVDYPFAIDELAFWLRRAGDEVASTGRTPCTPEQWQKVGCPYEEAVALEDVDELAALATYKRLGAAPAALRLTDRRRAAGLPVPRGPNTTTRGIPGGLTGRELDVLRLVAEGRTNAEIARVLHLSAKTVGHHVSHVLDKLGARTRTEAVSRAADVGVPLKFGVPLK